MSSQEEERRQLEEARRKSDMRWVCMCCAPVHGYLNPNAAVSCWDSTKPRWGENRDKSRRPWYIITYIAVWINLLWVCDLSGAGPKDFGRPYHQGCVDYYHGIEYVCSTTLSEFPGAREFVRSDCTKAESRSRCPVDETGILLLIKQVEVVINKKLPQVVADQIELEKRREEELELLYQ